MKTEIDWSKAPEGAIGFAPATGNNESSIWYKKNENGDLVFTFADLKEGWMQSYNVPENVIWRSEQWNGEGLPPVGTVCEHQGSVPGNQDWTQARVLAHAEVSGMPVAVHQIGDQISCSSAQYYRPIRTPEQIAAEEREAAIEEMWNVVYWQPHAPTAKAALGLLYDHGYRKTEGGAQ